MKYKIKNNQYDKKSRKVIQKVLYILCMLMLDEKSSDPHEVF